MMVKANQEECYKPFTQEIDRIMTEQQNYLNEMYMFIGTSEALDKVLDFFF